MRYKRNAVVIAAAGCLVCAVACIDFQHRNPFDPQTPLSVSIFPETLFSVARGPVQFTLVTVPPLTDPSAAWGVSSNELYGTNGTGLLYSAAAPLWPRIDTVPIIIGIGLHYVGANDPLHAGISQTITRSISASVIITQRLVRIRARCSGPPACDSLPAGATTSVFVDGFDALGSGLSGLPDSTANPLTAAPVFVFTIRDTTIVTALATGMRAAKITAKKAGATWIVAQRDSLRDSLRLVVR